jgi:hypothetical protein
MKSRPLIPTPALVVALCSDGVPTDEVITAQLSDTELLEVMVEVINLEDELELQSPGADVFEHPELLDPLYDSTDELSEDEALRTAYIILLYLG